MSSVDNNSSLNSILDKLGINQPKENKKSSDTLGQDDFLKLMTTQLQNQDPFKPTDNTEMIAQMAQFSMVTGQTEMNESIKAISGQLSEFRIATAANMLGHSFFGTRSSIALLKRGIATFPCPFRDSIVSSAKATS